MYPEFEIRKKLETLHREKRKGLISSNNYLMQYRELTAAYDKLIQTNSQVAGVYEGDAR